MGVIIIFSDIPDMFKIVSLWSHLKVFSGIEKKKNLFCWRNFFPTSDISQIVNKSLKGAQNLG